MRKTRFENGEYYHIFNRGVDKRKVFLDKEDYARFLFSVCELNDENLVGSLRDRKELKQNQPRSLASGKPLVEIITYCFNPNHYHFILRQLANKGIEKFMQRLGTAYTKYFNIKNDRSGSLFQGTFKSTYIKSNGLLLQLSAYVNCNSEVHGICKAEKYRWCSFSDYTGIRKSSLCRKKVILSQFKSIDDYRDFAYENVREMKEKKEMEKMLLE